MIQFDSAHKTPYGIHFVGNGGEEQLSVLTSGGQDGTFATIIAAMQVDGGATLTFQGRIPFKTFMSKMKEECERWLIGTEVSRGRMTEEDAKAKAKVQGDLTKMLEELDALYPAMV
jgi:hypothetical protein